MFCMWYSHRTRDKMLLLWWLFVASQTSTADASHKFIHCSECLCMRSISPPPFSCHNEHRPVRILIYEISDKQWLSALRVVGNEAIPICISIEDTNAARTTPRLVASLMWRNFLSKLRNSLRWILRCGCVSIGEKRSPYTACRTTHVSQQRRKKNCSSSKQRHFLWNAFSLTRM